MEIQLAGFMHRKLPERVHGMRTFCEDVKLKVLELPHAQRLLRRFARVRILVTVDDIPLPDTNDRVEDDGTALLFMQTVGPREAGPSLFPDFIFGGWWHIGLHEYDPFVSEIRRQAESPPVHDSAFWIGNPEMHESRVALLELSKRHATRVDARAIQWRHELGNASESTVPTSYMVRGSVVRIHPISNSLPDDVFVDEVPPKRVVMEEEEEGEEGSASSYFARNVLGNISTYVYKDEAAYLDHYRKSYFGITRKKTGWDSGRHLEIMASGSIPYFVDLHALPRRTLALYPRDEIAAAMAMRSVSVKNEAVAGGSDGRWYLDRDNFRVDPSTFDKAAYGRLASRVLEHARVHLSSSGMASYVLQTLGLTPFQASPVLFVTHFSTDFTGDSLLYGFQKILGAGAVVDAAFDTDGGFAHPWCDDAHRHLRAKPSLRRAPSTKESGGHVRFSVHGRLAAVEEDVSRDDLPQRVAAHEFGLIVFGSASRTTGDGLLDAAVHAGYSRERIALIYGEDMPYPLDEGLPMEAIQRPSHIPPSVPSIANTSKVGTVFQRELYDEPSSATGEPHHTEQTIMVPGVADRVERKWTTPMRMPLP